MRISDWSSDVCSSDLYIGVRTPEGDRLSGRLLTDVDHTVDIVAVDATGKKLAGQRRVQVEFYKIRWRWWWNQADEYLGNFTQDKYNQLLKKERSEEHTSELQSLMRISYAVFC